MKNLIDLTGKKFGKLTVISVARRAKNRNLIWKCLCECGNYTDVRSDMLRNAATKSCGCYHSEIMRSMMTTHGLHSLPEYKVWGDMKTRCINLSHPSYKDYGGRGIKVAPEWLQSFENFYADMGSRPSNKHSIERTDVNGDYCPENCIWATPKEQARNRRNNRIVNYNGIEYTLSELSELSGINRSYLFRYLELGKTTNEIINHYSTVKSGIDSMIEVISKDYVTGKTTIYKNCFIASSNTGIELRAIVERIFRNHNEPNSKMLAGYDFIDMAKVDSKNPPEWPQISIEAGKRSRESYFSRSLKRSKESCKRKDSIYE